MVLLLNCKRVADFFSNLIRNGKNVGFGSSDPFLGSTDGDVGGLGVLRSLVNVNLSVGSVFDFVDRSTSSSKDTGNSTGRNSELDTDIRLPLEL